MVEARNGGRIINITSVHEHIPRTGAPAYCSSKGGLGLLTKVMAMELAEYGILVNAVAPGEISTPMTGAEDEDPTTIERPKLPLGRPGHAREIAAWVAFLASEKASYATGASLVVDGGLMLMAAELSSRRATPRTNFEFVAEIPSDAFVEGPVTVGEGEPLPVTVVRFFWVKIFLVAPEVVHSSVYAQ
jgi:hypothetical protein